MQQICPTTNPVAKILFFIDYTQSIEQKNNLVKLHGELQYVDYFFTRLYFSPDILLVPQLGGLGTSPKYPGKDITW